MNTSLQDWTSIVLLEASAAGCHPLYPNIRSFPQALKNDMNFMYKAFDIDSARFGICNIMNMDDAHWSIPERAKRAWIHRRHNDSCLRMTNIMLKQTIEVVDDYE